MDEPDNVAGVILTMGHIRYKPNTNYDDTRLATYASEYSRASVVPVRFAT